MCLCVWVAHTAVEVDIRYVVGPSYDIVGKKKSVREVRLKWKQKQISAHNFISIANIYARILK